MKKVVLEQGCIKVLDDGNLIEKFSIFLVSKGFEYDEIYFTFYKKGFLCFSKDMEYYTDGNVFVRFNTSYKDRCVHLDLFNNTVYYHSESFLKSKQCRLTCELLEEFNSIN